MVDEVVEFFREHMNGIIYSTHAKPIDLSVDVYNVKGSSDDPKLSASWKALLEEYEIYGPCYVTNQKPDKPDTSHDKGTWLGGHMALTKDGLVEPGGITYLMPLCAWHNSKSRDEKKL